MSLAGIAPMGTPTKRVVVGAAVAKTRSFTSTTLVHMPDAHVRRLIDEAVEKAPTSHVEEWWEHDHAYGIMKDIVVRISDKFEGATRKFYAVVRPALKPEFPGQEIIVTVVDEAERKISIRDQRWLPNKPHAPKIGSLEHKALEKVREHMKEKVEKKHENPETHSEVTYLVRDGDHEFKFQSLEEAKKKIMDVILLEGTPVNKVSLWKKLPIGLDLKVEVK